jgi:hypothetical protein
MEAYGEYLFHAGPLVGGVRAGRYRTPFGIDNGSDYSCNGFFRAPLIRYGGYFALSNNYLEHGTAVFIGTPHLLVESSVGVPGDVGDVKRRSGLDVVARLQAYAGPLIVGVSHIRTPPYLPASFALGDAELTGVDARWMVGGVQLRGEWLFGTPFDGTTTDGGYVDVSVHRPIMGPVTAVFRTERISYSAQVDLLHQTSQVAYGAPLAVDVGLTYSVRH